MTIIAIDPGYTQSAIVHYDPLRKAVVESLYEDNPYVIKWLDGREEGTLVIEHIASYGMPVGQEVFDTCVWIGRFVQVWGGQSHLLYRKHVKLFLCGSTKAKDGNIRAALLDKFGGSRARGTKRQPGPLYGLAGDKWAALAVAVTWAETGMIQ